MKIGKILTWRELRALPNNSSIYVYYLDEDGEVMTDAIVEFEREGNNYFLKGYSHFDECDESQLDDPIQNYDNGGWSLTIREVIKKGTR